MNNVENSNAVRIGPDLFVSFDETKNLIKRNYEYNELTEEIKDKVVDILESYIQIGHSLNIIKDKALFEMNDYKNIYDYSLTEVGLSKTTTKNLISVTKRFCDNGSLKVEYEGFGFSHLVELLSIDDNDINSYIPSMTVKAIRSKKIELQVNEKLESMLSKEGILTKIINVVLDFDWKKNIGLVDFKIDHEVIQNKYEVIGVESWEYGSYSVKIIFNLCSLKIKTKFTLDISFAADKIRICGDNPWFWRALDSFNDLSKELTYICENHYTNFFKVKDAESIKQVDEHSELINLGKNVDSGSTLSKVCLYLSTNVFKDYYYSVENWNEKNISLFAHKIKNNKTNPPLFKLTDLDDASKSAILNCVTKEMTVIFEDFNNYISKKIDVLSKMLNE